MLLQFLLFAASLSGDGRQAAKGGFVLQPWMKIAIIVAGIFAVILVVRAFQRMENKWVPLTIGGVIAAVLVLQMLYFRTEPAWLSPLFDRLAEFFPTAGHTQREFKGP